MIDKKNSSKAGLRKVCDHVYITHRWIHFASTPGSAFLPLEASVKKAFD